MNIFFIFLFLLNYLNNFIQFLIIKNFTMIYDLWPGMSRQTVFFFEKKIHWFSDFLMIFSIFLPIFRFFIKFSGDFYLINLTDVFNFSNFYDFEKITSFLLKPTDFFIFFQKYGLSAHPYLWLFLIFLLILKI